MRISRNEGIEKLKLFGIDAKENKVLFISASDHRKLIINIFNHKRKAFQHKGQVFEMLLLTFSVEAYISKKLDTC